MGAASCTRWTWAQPARAASALLPRRRLARRWVRRARSNQAAVARGGGRAAGGCWAWSVLLSAARAAAPGCCAEHKWPREDGRTADRAPRPPLPNGRVLHSGRATRCRAPRRPDLLAGSGAAARGRREADDRSSSASLPGPCQQPHSAFAGQHPQGCRAHPSPSSPSSPWWPSWWGTCRPWRPSWGPWWLCVGGSMQGREKEGRRRVEWRGS